MKCPECHSEKVSIINSRSETMRNAVRRRRECDACGNRWSTQEISESLMGFLEKQLSKLQALEPFEVPSHLEGELKKARACSWTQSETQILISMYFEDVQLNKIAEALDRSYTSIAKRIQFLKKNKLLVKPNTQYLEG